MRLLIRVFFVIFFIILPAKVYAQYNKIAGVVVDSITSEPIPFATISIKGDNKSIMTNDNGEFETTINENKNITITTSSVGYHRSSNKFNISDSNFVTIKLIPSGVVLNEITVKKQKHKYSKKNNPAVIFANKIRSAKNIGDPYNHEFYNYNKYEKITLGLNNFTDNAQNSWMFEKFKFLNDYVDTSEVSGKPILNVSVKEKASQMRCFFLP